MSKTIGDPHLDETSPANSGELIIPWRQVIRWPDGYVWPMGETVTQHPTHSDGMTTQQLVGSTSRQSPWKSVINNHWASIQTLGSGLDTHKKWMKDLTTIVKDQKGEIVVRKDSIRILSPTGATSSFHPLHSGSDPRTYQAHIKTLEKMGLGNHWLLDRWKSTYAPKQVIRKQKQISIREHFINKHNVTNDDIIDFSTADLKEIHETFPECDFKIPLVKPKEKPKKRSPKTVEEAPKEETLTEEVATNLPQVPIQPKPEIKVDRSQYCRHEMNPAACSICSKPRTSSWKSISKQKKEKGGDCYEAAGIFLMDNQHLDKSMRLAHGTVTSNQRLGDFGHAWVEIGDIVIDKSNGLNVTMPKEKYYKLGGIKDVVIYDFRQMADLALKTKHWGPWHKTNARHAWKSVMSSPYNANIISQLKFKLRDLETELHLLAYLPWSHPDNPGLPAGHEVAHIKWGVHPDEDHCIKKIWVAPGLERNGIATELYNAAKEIDPLIVHDKPEARTPKGEKWIQSLGSWKSVIAHNDPDRDDWEDDDWDDWDWDDEDDDWDVPTTPVSPSPSIVEPSGYNEKDDPVVAFVNASTLLTDKEVELIQKACQKQVDDHFGPSWHLGMRSVFIPKGQSAPHQAWQLIFLDNPTIAGALGYHDFINGQPIAYVFISTSQKAKVSPSSVASHEVLEMLSDPLINTTAQVANQTFYALESCDAVQQSSYNVTVELADMSYPVEVSNFVTPDWFRTQTNGPWDYLRKLNGPLELLPNGSYIGMWTPKTGWIQKNAYGQIEPMEEDDKRYIGEEKSTTVYHSPQEPQRCLRPFQRRQMDKPLQMTSSWKTILFNSESRPSVCPQCKKSDGVIIGKGRNQKFIKDPNHPLVDCDRASFSEGVVQAMTKHTSWKSVTAADDTKFEQMSLLPSEPQQKPKKPKLKRRRTEFYFLQPYTAPGTATCDSHSSECHQNGAVEEGDKMIRAIGIPGTVAGGLTRFFHSDGPCETIGLARIDSEAAKIMQQRRNK